MLLRTMVKRTGTFMKECSMKSPFSVHHEFPFITKVTLILFASLFSRYAAAWCCSYCVTKFMYRLCWRQIHDAFQRNNVWCCNLLQDLLWMFLYRRHYSQQHKYGWCKAGNQCLRFKTFACIYWTKNASAKTRKVRNKKCGTMKLNF